MLGLLGRNFLSRSENQTFSKVLQRFNCEPTQTFGCQRKDTLKRLQNSVNNKVNFPCGTSDKVTRASNSFRSSREDFERENYSFDTFNGSIRSLGPRDGKAGRRHHKTK